MHVLEHGSSGDHGADLLFSPSDTASASDAKSGVFVDLLLPFAAWLDADMLSFLIRKGAHFSIYALLGICVYMALFSCGEGKGGSRLDHLRAVCVQR